MSESSPHLLVGVEQQLNWVGATDSAVASTHILCHNVWPEKRKVPHLKNTFSVFVVVEENNLKEHPSQVSATDATDTRSATAAHK